MGAQQRKSLVVERSTGPAAPLRRQHEQVPQPARRDGREPDRAAGPLGDQHETSSLCSASADLPHLRIGEAVAIRREDLHVRRRRALGGS